MSEIADLGCLSVTDGIFPVSKMGGLLQLAKNTSPKLKMATHKMLEDTKKEIGIGFDCIAV